MNNIYIVGNLVKAPENRITQTNNQIATFPIAVYSGKDKDDNVLTSFFDVTAWNKVAEGIMDFIPGTKILIEGKLKQDVYTNKENKKISRVYIIADRIHLISFPKLKEKEVDNNEKKSDDEYPFK